MTPQLTGLLAGLAAAVGLLAIAGAVSRHVPVAPPRARLAGLIGRHRRAVLALLVVVAVVAVARMPVVALAAAGLLWLAPTMAESSRRRASEQAMLEAVHLWLLQLRTVLAAGTGLEQAVGEVAALQPAHSPLAAPAARLTVRMERVGPLRALRAFAQEVDNHLADAAVAVLGNALTRQNVGVAAALDGLIAWAEQEVRQARDIDARPQSVRTERTMVIGIFAAIAAYFMVANRELLAVYATTLGQLVLAAILAIAGLCVWSLDRMARPERPTRFFAQESGR
ncbi:hypothetical protein FTX61_19750 [Nitriliruptoraceae bacterium ZYF776]|nr:hypothetical protein [Profundirhabdus halotolerans]